LAAQLSFGDEVRVLPSGETSAQGLAGLTGQIRGYTMPSVTGVEVIGHRDKDAAFNVYFESLERDFWFDPVLLEFVSHSPGTEIEVEGPSSRAIRNPDGAWSEVPLKTNGWLKRLRTFLFGPPAA
jgi:hypothetical protein